MDKNDEEILAFLKQQLEWYKEQDAILEKIERKLYEMKAIAEYRVENEVTPAEIERLNQQLQDLKAEVQLLEKQLYSGIIH